MTSYSKGKEQHDKHSPNHPSTPNNYSQHQPSLTTKSGTTGGYISPLYNKACSMIMQAQQQSQANRRISLSRDYPQSDQRANVSRGAEREHEASKELILPSAYTYNTGYRKHYKDLAPRVLFRTKKKKKHQKDKTENRGISPMRARGRSCHDGYGQWRTRGSGPQGL